MIISIKSIEIIHHILKIQKNIGYILKIYEWWEAWKKNLTFDSLKEDIFQC